ncbi:MAG: hypothetical protein ISS14_05905 [Actinobacteria bacterium]|nr:hypothetical protein [Actinomycetota bacterium]MBL7124409.1 hypothetical protein [Actinomycetota bacterium]
MKIFNRVVVIIVLFKIILFSIIAVVNKIANLFTWTDVSNKVIGSIANLNIYITGVILLLVVAGCIVLLVFEFRKKE